jgi:hypothetical protein
MATYLNGRPFSLAMIVSLVAALAFVYPAVSGQGGAGGPPQFAFARAILANSPSEVAPLLDMPPGQLVEALRAKGFSAADRQTSLLDIAARSNKNEQELVAALVRR